MPKRKAGFINTKPPSKGKKTRQGHGRGTKYNTREVLKDSRKNAEVKVNSESSRQGVCRSNRYTRR